MVSLYSNKVVWWQCEHGHEWQAPINRRSGGIGCPICSNKKVLSGYNGIQLKTKANNQQMYCHSQTKKHGGFVKKATNGKRQLIVVVAVMDVLIVKVFSVDKKELLT